jgi:hypothetical protein
MVKSIYHAHASLIEVVKRRKPSSASWSLFGAVGALMFA